MGDVIEIASSARAKCRGCHQKIEKGELRYGEAVENPFGSGEALHWFHLRCGAERRAQGFAEALDGHAGDVPQRAELEHLAALGRAHPRWSRLARAERAPSGRARCQHCRELIEKGELRIVLERTEDGMVSPAGFVHARCVSAYAGTVEGVLDRLRRAAPALSPEDATDLEGQLA